MSPSKTPCDKDARDFGANIAARRRKLGLSQMQVAEMVDMTQESLSRIESGLATPKFQRLRAFADALQCSVADLFMSMTDAEKDKGRLFAELIHPLPLCWQDTVLKSALQLTHAIRNNLEAMPDAKGDKGDKEGEEC